MNENEKPSNPNAFPILDPNSSYYEPGMTLRDYFANTAMQAMLSSRSMYDIMNNKVAYVLSKEAYFVADAMLKQRELKTE